MKYRPFIFLLIFAAILIGFVFGVVDLSAAQAPSLSAPPEEGAGSAAAAPSGFWSLLHILGSIALVTGAGLLVLWLMKITQGDAGRKIPDSIVKPLGKTAIGGSPVYLVLAGKKLLLVASSTAGLRTLAEITDSEEIEAIQKEIAEAKP